MKLIAQYSAISIALPILVALVLLYFILRAFQRAKQADDKLKHLTDQQFRPEAISLRKAEQLIEEKQQELMCKFNCERSLKENASFTGLYFSAKPKLPKQNH